MFVSGVRVQHQWSTSVCYISSQALATSQCQYLLLVSIASVPHQCPVFVSYTNVQDQCPVLCLLCLLSVCNVSVQCQCPMSDISVQCLVSLSSISIHCQCRTSVSTVSVHRQCPSSVSSASVQSVSTSDPPESHHLVLHERDEWGDDDSDAAGEHRRVLVTQTLAVACNQHTSRS